MPRRVHSPGGDDVYLDEHDLATVAAKRIGWEIDRELLTYRRDELVALGQAATAKHRRKLATVEKSLAQREPDWEAVVLEEKRLNPRKPERAIPARESRAAVIKLSLQIEREMAAQVAKNLAKKNKQRKAQTK